MISKKYAILDTSALLLGITLPENLEIYTTPSVLSEVKSKKIIVEGLVRSGIIKVMRPSQSSILNAKRAYAEIGGKGITSTDLEIIGLAIELSVCGEVIVYTDDYSLQNILRKLNIPYSTIAQKGIRSLYQWAYICEGCGKLYWKPKRNICKICGSQLKPKVVRKYESEKSGCSKTYRG